MKKLLLLIAIFIIGCDSSAFKSTSDFYHDRMYPRNTYRLPLIEPYELCTEMHKLPLEWQVNFQTDSIYFQYPVYMNYVGIHDDIIVLHSTMELQNRRPAWYIINAKNNCEQRFYDSLEYLSYLKSLNATVVKWYDIDSLYDAFSKNGLYPPGWPRKSIYDTVSKNDSS